jgi:hypothetical protein
MSNFSKLIIDPSKPLTSRDLVRDKYSTINPRSGKPYPISFNKDGYRIYERLEFYYLEY